MLRELGRTSKIDSTQVNEPVVITGGFMTAPGNYRRWQKILATPVFNRLSVISHIHHLHWLNGGKNSFKPQINALNDAVNYALKTTKSEKVWLLCHSAGGTVARLWLGNELFNGTRWKGFEKVRGVIFLGSPYQSLEPRTQALTQFLNESYPGAFYQDLKYVSVIGKAVFGQPNGNGLQKLAYKSYQLLHEEPEKWGDGIITVDAAHIPSGKNYVIKNVFHAPFFGLPDYMHPAALKLWGHHLRSARNIGTENALIKTRVI